jgi:hypothetical protein
VYGFKEAYPSLWGFVNLLLKFFSLKKRMFPTKELHICNFEKARTETLKKLRSALQEK